MSTQFVRVSDIPVPTAMGQERAFTYHVERYYRWLRSAGASPRVATFLVRDDEIQTRFLAELSAQNVEVVHGEVSEKRPIPEALLRHQGDHFNRRLFVINGLNTDNSTTLWPLLERYVDHYAKVATWVGFVINDPNVLDQCRRLAPSLWSRIQRSVPLGGTLSQSSDFSTSAHGVSETTLRILCGSTPNDYHGWSRWMRTGYGHSVDFTDGGSESLVHDFWRKTNGFQLSQSFPESTTLMKQVVQRHCDDLIDYPFVPPSILSIEDRALAEWISSMHAHLRKQSVPNRPDTAQLQSLILNAQSADLVVEALLTSAHCYAIDGQLEGMLNALEFADKRAKSGSLEARFEVQARRTETWMLLERHLEARNEIAKMVAFEPHLLSPFYEARLLMLKGRSMSHLDQMKSEEFYTQAFELFSIHGYPRYAEDVSNLRKGSIGG